MLRLLWEKAKDQTSNNVVFDISLDLKRFSMSLNGFNGATRGFDLRAQFPQ